MPPEQLLNKKIDLKKADIFSLGVSLFMIFNLLPPYSLNEQNPLKESGEILHRILKDSLPYKKDIPEKL